MSDTLHVFDLDGTLYDTLEANTLAYETAGLEAYTREEDGNIPTVRPSDQTYMGDAVL